MYSISDRVSLIVFDDLCLIKDLEMIYHEGQHFNEAFDDKFYP